MKFPNLVWAICERRLAHYELAGRAKMEPTRFSRCLSGRLEFAPHERERISQLLNLNADWLFAQPVPRPLEPQIHSGVVRVEKKL